MVSSTSYNNKALVETPYSLFPNAHTVKGIQRVCCSCNCFPKFSKFLTPLLILILSRIVWIHELCFCFPFATSLDCFEVNCLHAFGELLMSETALSVDFGVWF